MLVLTRRETEKILLPDVGVTVELMSVSGNRARLGISAGHHSDSSRRSCCEPKSGPTSGCPRTDSP